MHWAGRPAAGGPRSHAGTIWADATALHARTGLTRVDPVYLAEVPGAVVVSDRAALGGGRRGPAGRSDPVMVGAFLSLGYPVGAATPFRGVRALGDARQLTVTGGERPVVPPVRTPDADPGRGRRPGRCRPARCGRVRQRAAALVEAVGPLGELGCRSSCP